LDPNAAPRWVAGPNLDSARQKEVQGVSSPAFAGVAFLDVRNRLDLLCGDRIRRRPGPSSLGGL
jgi:hypothetical protein